MSVEVEYFVRVELMKLFWSELDILKISEWSFLMKKTLDINSPIDRTTNHEENIKKLRMDSEYTRLLLNKLL